MNGDGVNDVWHVETFPDMEATNFNVFDNTGNRIYSSTGYAIPWDGTFKGSLVPEGVYYYTISGPSFKKSGYILVVR
ncbi:MAG: gliding motility-associated C-terminal domain-containing protein [Flavobacteriaceae bacterium]|nr:gliding motility-associated C-terminal domain-containing protein [Flavobacteriaceae bacterium]